MKIHPTHKHNKDQIYQTVGQHCDREQYRDDYKREVEYELNPEIIVKVTVQQY